VGVAEVFAFKEVGCKIIKVGKIKVVGTSFFGNF